MKEMVQACTSHGKYLGYHTQQAVVSQQMDRHTKQKPRRLRKSWIDAVHQQDL